MIIDVRSREEYRTGNVPESFNIPVDEIATFDLATYSLTKETPILLYCRSGARASFAKMILEKRGLKNVKLYKGAGALSV